MTRLAEKTAVITGAADGIGHAIAEVIAREGAHVFLGDIADGAGEDFAAALRAAGHSANYVHCDVSQEVDIAGLIDSAMKKTGRLDVLVGCQHRSRRPGLCSRRCRHRRPDRRHEHGLRHFVGAPLSRKTGRGQKTEVNLLTSLRSVSKVKSNRPRFTDADTLVAMVEHGDVFGVGGHHFARLPIALL